MATIKFILDRRAVRDGAEAPVKVSIGHQRKTALLPVNIFLTEEQWDAHAQMVVKHPSRLKYNQIIARLRVQVTDIIAGLINRPGGISGMTTTQIKNEVQNILNPKAAPQPEPVEPPKPEDDPNTFQSIKKLLLSELQLKTIEYNSEIEYIDYEIDEIVRSEMSFIQ